MPLRSYPASNCATKRASIDALKKDEIILCTHPGAPNDFKTSEPISIYPVSRLNSVNLALTKSTSSKLPINIDIAENGSVNKGSSIETPLLGSPKTPKLLPLVFEPAVLREMSLRSMSENVVWPDFRSSVFELKSKSPKTIMPPVLSRVSANALAFVTTSPTLDTRSMIGNTLPRS